MFQVFSMIKSSLTPLLLMSPAQLHRGPFWSLAAYFACALVSLQNILLVFCCQFDGALRSFSCYCMCFLNLESRCSSYWSFRVFERCRMQCDDSCIRISKNWLSKYGGGCQNADVHCAKDANPDASHDVIAENRFILSLLCARVCLCIGVWYEDWWGDLS